jgi:tmRNA-binding protein
MHDLIARFKVTFEATYPIDVFGETFYIRRWSAGDRIAVSDAYVQYDKGKQPLETYLVEIVIRSLCRVDGKPVFTDADRKDILLLDWNELRRIREAAEAANPSRTAEAKND